MSTNDDHPTFRGLDPFAPVRVYRRHLPHWRQDGATYFVTFRLADSIPSEVLLKWQEEDRVWLKANGIDGPLSDPRWQAAYDRLAEKQRQAFERSASRRIHVELDVCHGSCLFRHPAARAVLTDALRHFHGVRWWVGDFVAMPNHVHGLWQPRDGHELECVVASVKGFVSTQLTKLGLKAGSLWQQENYDRLVRDRKELTAWRHYIQQNPAKARLGDLAHTDFRCTWLDVLSA